MTPDQVEQLANELMVQHGLIRKGWGFKWSSGKQRLGCAQIRKARDRQTGKTRTLKSILISRHLVELNSDEVIRDVILHEIAHALAGIKNGHNHVWRETCEKIGAKPQRLAGEEVAVVAARYAIVCGVCEEQLATRHRRSTPKHLDAAYCKHCGPTSKGKLKLIDQADTQDALP